MTQRKMTEPEILDGFENALRENQIFACYQPQYNHSAGRMTGAEALMRWNHPEYGRQYPADFIPALEKHGLIYRADLHVFETVCRSDPWESFTPENRNVYEKTIQKAIQSGNEKSCETWRTVCSKCCGEDKVCIRSHIRVIGKAGNQYIVYAMVRNVTAEKQNYLALYDSERRFRLTYTRGSTRSARSKCGPVSGVCGICACRRRWKITPIRRLTWAFSRPTTPICTATG